MLKAGAVQKALWRYLAGLAIYGMGMVIYTQNGFYKGFIQPDTLKVLKSLFLAYFFLGWPFHVLNWKTEGHKPSQLIGTLLRWPKKLSPSERNTLLFFLVKLFYVPVMLNFVVTNFKGIIDIVSYRIFSGNFTFDLRNDYLSIFPIVFALDTLFFAAGYLVEHPRLKNTIRSVESTLLGWAAALITYPPFNNLTANFLGWYSNDYFFFGNALLDVGLKLVAVGLLLVYLWATFSLGLKSSNLTNRGIVTNGAYKYVRHPAYASKVLFWWLTALPRFSPSAVLSLIGWSAIYYLRVITEEKHLGLDPDYRKYQKKTRFLFIPGVW